MTAGASGAIFGLMGAAVVVMRSRGIGIMESGIGLWIGLNLLITFTIPGISIGGHIGGLVGGALVAFAVAALAGRGKTADSLVVLVGTEATLVERAKRDPAAFGALYDRYVDQIYGYTLRETRDVTQAQDITAATFEKALRHIRRFRWGEAGFAPWLYKIARNEIVQQYRRARRLHPFAPDDDDVAERDMDVQSRETRPIESAVLSAERDQNL